MVNYNNGKVYKIWSLSGDKIYIGSTTKEYLSQRMDTHRNNYKNWKNGIYHNITVYNIFDEYGLENCKIELLEAKECKDKHELLKLEGEYIRKLECVNKQIAGRTRKEYYDENREKLLEQKKQYHINNREKRNNYMREYRKLKKGLVN